MKIYSVLRFVLTLLLLVPMALSGCAKQESAMDSSNQINAATASEAQPLTTESPVQTGDEAESASDIQLDTDDSAIETTEEAGESLPSTLDTKTERLILDGIPSVEHYVRLMIGMGPEQAAREKLADEIAAFLTARGYKNVLLPHQYFVEMGIPSQSKLVVEPVEENSDTVTIKIFS